MAKKKDEDPIEFTPDKSLDEAVENTDDVTAEDKPKGRAKKAEPEPVAESTLPPPSQPVPQPPPRDFPGKTPAIPSQPTR